jgi:hypothetical protein
MGNSVENRAAAVLALLDAQATDGNYIENYADQNQYSYHEALGRVSLALQWQAKFKELGFTTEHLKEICGGII